jgi:hypothetical protein
MLKPSDCRFETTDEGVYVIVDRSRSIAGSLGPVVKEYADKSSADRAAKKGRDFKVYELNKHLPPGSHINALTDVIFDRRAKFEVPRFNPAIHRFSPTTRTGGR